MPVSELGDCADCWPTAHLAARTRRRSSPAARLAELERRRSGVLARWAAALLTVSTAGTAALAVLPDSFNRPMAVPEGIALIGLGISLWRLEGRRRTIVLDDPIPSARRLDSRATSPADKS